MIGQSERQERALAALNKAVDAAVCFFNEASERVSDGQHTAHEVLAQLVYWHCEHLRIAQALTRGEKPSLKTGSLPKLNDCACQQFRQESMPELAQRLAALQSELEPLLRALPDWDTDFPIKVSCRTCTVEDRVYGLAANIYHHTAELRRVVYTQRRYRPQWN